MLQLYPVDDMVAEPKQDTPSKAASLQAMRRQNPDRDHSSLGNPSTSS